MTTTTVRYIVDKTDTAIDFYTKHLGFEVKLHPAPGFAALERNGLRLLLNQPGAGGAGQDMPDGQTPTSGGWNRIQISVSDLKSVLADLKEQGIPFRSGIIEGNGGKQVLLEDPSGNPVELFEPGRPVKSASSGGSYKPEGYATVTPYLAIREAEKLVEFLAEIFDAEEHRVMRREDGSFMHGEFRIGDSMVMIGDVQDRYPPFPGMLHVYVSDVDETYRQALEHGATSVEKPSDQDYGERRAAFTDPSGNRWYVAMAGA